MHGIVSFYHDFRRTPPGRHRLLVCRAGAFQSVGGEALGADARLASAVDWQVEYRALSAENRRIEVPAGE